MKPKIKYVAKIILTIITVMVSIPLVFSQEEIIFLLEKNELLLLAAHGVGIIISIIFIFIDKDKDNYKDINNFRTKLRKLFTITIIPILVMFCVLEAQTLLTLLKNALSTNLVEILILYGLFLVAFTILFNNSIDDDE